MKKILLSCLALVLMFGLVACTKKQKTTYKDTIVVSVTTASNGDNLLGTTWGNNGTDASVRRMIYGTSTVMYNPEDDEYQVDDKVVADSDQKENFDGETLTGKTYSFTIKEGLKFSDGTPITAKDYVFGILFGETGAWEAVVNAQEGSWSPADTYLGEYDYYEATAADEANYAAIEHPGIHLVGEYEFSYTINSHDIYGDPLFPYFFEQYAYMSVTPYPMHVMAPNLDIVEGTTGAKFVKKAEPTAALTEAEMVTEFTTYITNENKTGYRYAPTITAGPYVFARFDSESNTYTLTKNPNYVGDYSGQVALTNNIVLKYESSTTQITSLSAGEVDLVSGVSGGDSINSGIEAVTRSGGALDFTNYARNGYGQLAFTCDTSATKYKEVRQAVAFLLNRAEFLQTYTGGYGALPNGAYGTGQWMVAAATENGQVMGIDANGQKVSLKEYSYNPTEAASLLEAAGFVWGDVNCTEPFDAATHSVRFKKNDDGTVERCSINWGATTDNPVSDTLRTTLVENAKTVGLEIVEKSYASTAFGTMLYTNLYGMFGDGYASIQAVADYYADETGEEVTIYDVTPEMFLSSYEKVPVDARGNFSATGSIEEDAREVTMFNYAAGFTTHLFDPYGEASIMYWGWDGGAYNTYYLYDEGMDAASNALRTASTREEYLEAWQKYQYYINDLLPILPLYSDLYHDFFNANMEGYKGNVTSNWTWEYQIVGCRVKA